MGAVVLAALPALVTLPAAATPAAVAPPVTDLASARAEATALRARLAQTRAEVARAVARYETAERSLAAAVNRGTALERQLEQARASSYDAGRLARQRVAALYRTGGTGLLATLVSSRDPQDFFARARSIDAVLAADQLRSSASLDVTLALTRLEEGAAAATSEQLRLTRVLEDERVRVGALFAEQQAALGAADARVRRIVEEQAAAARARAAQALVNPLPGAFGDGYAGPPGRCPVGPVHSFVDTWLAPRSGGRQHQGTDVFAPKGSPAYAVVDGVVERVTDGSLGGLGIWLRGANGDRYYYAHEDLVSVAVGQRVQAGEVIGTVGNTGNAETTPAHVHFEAHPGGGAAVNPYRWLAALCAQ